MQNFVTYKLKASPHNVFGYDYKSLSILGGILKIETISEPTKDDITIKTIELSHDVIDGPLGVWFSD